MGDVPLIAGCLIGTGVIYCVILTILTVRTETTERPDLTKRGGKKA